MKNIILILLLFVTIAAKSQFLDVNNYDKTNIFYNWGKPAKVILDFALDSSQENKSKIRLAAKYESIPEETIQYLFDFRLAKTKREAEIEVQKLLYQDSIVIIGKESKKKREVFTYVFKNMSEKLELLDIRTFDDYQQIGKLYLYPNNKKVYVQNMSLEYRAVAVYNNNDFVIDYIVDLSKSARSRSVVTAVKGFKQPIKYGAIDLRTMEVLIPFEYPSIHVLQTESGKSFIAVNNNSESALFDSTATNLTGFILKGKVKSVHNDETIQLIKSSDNNPMIVNFKGTVICETFDDFPFDKLIPMKYGFYCITDGKRFRGFVTPKGESSGVYGFLDMKLESAIDNVTKEFDENGCFKYRLSSSYHQIVNSKGEFFDDSENEICYGCLYREGLIVVRNRLTQLYGFMDVDFKLILPCIYEGASSFPPSFYDGKAKVIVNGETFYIDQKGNRVSK